MAKVSSVTNSKDKDGNTSSNATVRTNKTVKSKSNSKSVDDKFKIPSTSKKIKKSKTPSTGNANKKSMTGKKNSNANNGGSGSGISLDKQDGEYKIDYSYNKIKKKSLKKYKDHKELIPTKAYDLKRKKNGEIKRNKKGAVVSKKGANKEVARQNPYGYPKVKGNAPGGRKKYDYTIAIQSDIIKAINKEKKNLNIPSAYSRLQLNKRFHEKFNRFKIQYPDYFLNNTIGYVFFTRPDLNLFDSDGNANSQVESDPQLYYAVMSNEQAVKSLTKNYAGGHHFIPLLCNTVMSLDVSDESIETVETGQTYTGYKTQYAQTNVRSMTAGTINVTFPETYNMAITALHQVWCSYESGVYRGILEPKAKYIWNKEIDYACDIYYFLVDAQDMIIRYWCKYTGCFPLNVNKSVFSYSGDTHINHPNLNISYAYFAREDMSFITLGEFNNNAGGVSANWKYKALYNPIGGVSGDTWASRPFIQHSTINNGFGQAQIHYLRFKP